MELYNDTTGLTQYICQRKFLNFNKMSNLLIVDGIALIKIWAVGFFVFHFTGVIHILPGIALLAFIIRFLYQKTLIPTFTKK